MFHWERFFFWGTSKRRESDINFPTLERFYHAFTKPKMDIEKEMESMRWLSMEGRGLSLSRLPAGNEDLVQERQWAENHPNIVRIHLLLAKMCKAQTEMPEWTEAQRKAQ